MWIPRSSLHRPRQGIRKTSAILTLTGNTWHFGYKAHIGVDRDSGLVHAVKSTAANVHDVTMTSGLLHGEEYTVNGDSGYIGAEKRKDAIVRNKAGKKIQYRINRCPSQIRKLSRSGQYKAKKREHAKSSACLLSFWWDCAVLPIFHVFYLSHLSRFSYLFPRK